MGDDGPSFPRFMKGSVSNPMNRLMALNVACCDPVAVSPETCVNPAGVRLPNTIGMPPVALKKLVIALPTDCWFSLKQLPKFGADGGTKFSARLRKTSVAS